MLAILLFVPASAARQTQAAYEIIDLGPATGWRSYDAKAINDAGQVVGTYYPSDGAAARAYLWDSGTRSDILVYPWDINNSAQVVGTSGGRGYVWQNGAMTEIGMAGYTRSDARGINDSGDVLGFAYNFNQPVHPFILRNGQTTEITIPNDNDIATYGINNAGLVAGSYHPVAGKLRAFLWQDGVVTDLVGLFGSDNSSRALGLSNLGQAVGDSWVPGTGVLRATLWDSGQAIDLGTNGQALAINDRGQIVGSSSTFGAFLYQDGVLTNLNTLLPPNSGWTGLVTANDINESGWIVGTGIVNGQNHAFLITPEPATLALLAIAGAFAFKRRR